MENIKGGAGNHGVAHGVLLVQKTGVGAWFYFVPATPFVYHQGYFLLRIVFVHNSSMFLNQFIHKQSALHSGKILLLVKSSRWPFFIPVDYRIMVQGDAFDQAFWNIF